MGKDFEAELRRVSERSNADLRARVEEDIEALRQANVSSFESLVSMLQRKDAPLDLRLSACWVLGQLRDQRAVGPLLTVFIDEAGFSWEAAKALGIIGSKRATPRLMSVLRESEDAERRAAAAYSLGLIRDPRGVASLLSVLGDPSLSPKLRGHAAEALGYVRDASAIDTLVVALRDDSAEVRYWAAFALGNIGDGRALPELRRLAATDQARLPGGETVSHAAKEAIESIEARTRLEDTDDEGWCP